MNNNNYIASEWMIQNKEWNQRKKYKESRRRLTERWQSLIFFMQIYELIEKKHEKNNTQPRTAHNY